MYIGAHFFVFGYHRKGAEVCAGDRKGRLRLLHTGPDREQARVQLLRGGVGQASWGSEGRLYRSENDMHIVFSLASSALDDIARW